MLPLRSVSRVRAYVPGVRSPGSATRLKSARTSEAEIHQVIRARYRDRRPECSLSVDSWASVPLWASEDRPNRTTTGGSNLGHSVSQTQPVKGLASDRPQTLEGMLGAKSW